MQESSDTASGHASRDVRMVFEVISGAKTIFVAYVGDVSSVMLGVMNERWLPSESSW